jgi:hypothetical protein
VLTLWRDAGARDAGLADIKDALGNLDIGYCLVVGRGDSGTWWVNAGDAPDVCRDVGSDLGGQVDQSDGS